MKLDLGCGKNKFSKKFIGIDNNIDADIRWDLEKGLPKRIKDNSVEEIVMRHSLEHISNVWKLMDDIWRVLKPEGKLRVWAPHYSSWTAFSTLDHKKFFSIKTFDHLTLDNEQNYYCKAKFKINKKELHYFSEVPKFRTINKIISSLTNFNHTFYEKFMARILPCDEIYFEMEAVK
jgi:ubiquinone/menaquinone biosynthesis C-methylase UbiE